MGKPGGKKKNQRRGGENDNAEGAKEHNGERLVQNEISKKKGPGRKFSTRKNQEGSSTQDKKRYKDAKCGGEGGAQKSDSTVPLRKRGKIKWGGNKVSGEKESKQKKKKTQKGGG